MSLIRNRPLILAYAQAFSLSLYEALAHYKFVGADGLQYEINGEMPSESEEYFAETGEECYEMLRSSGATIQS